MSKVLFFDSWKGGIKSFLRILKPLKEVGIDSLLIHLGSWGNEIDFLKEEVISDLLVRDISFYGTSDFEKILEIEKPDLVLFLSTSTFAHRAFNRYCNQKNIPTIFLYHSIARVENVDGVGSPYKTKLTSYFKFVLERLPPLLTKALPTYVKSLLRTNASKEDWKYLFLNILGHIITPSKRKIAIDAKTTLCLVFTDVDKSHAMSQYGFKKEEVLAIGNSDLVEFKFGVEHRNSMSNRNVSLQNKNVLYIDTGLVVTGLFFKDVKEHKQHILNTHNALIAQGKQLFFKPHPALNRDIYINYLKNEGIQIVENDVFMEVLETCCAAIIESSTLSVIPCLTGMPIFLAQYDKLKDLKFGHVLLSYPNAQSLTDVNNFNKLLNNLELFTDDANGWIDENIGPLPAKDMPKRVAAIALNLITEKNKSNP